MQNISYIIGIDPSFSGLGAIIIDLENKIITMKELKVDLGEGTFPYIAKASVDMTDLLLTEVPEITHPYIMSGMEVPPTQGLYSVKLWALDTHIYNSFFMKKPFLFSTSYLRFIHGHKPDGKKDTINLISKVIEIFKDNGYTIEQTLKTKTNKDRKITSNEADAFLYATRIFVKYHLEAGIASPIVVEILNLNERFSENKENFYREELPEYDF